MSKRPAAKGKKAKPETTVPVNQADLMFLRKDAHAVNRLASEGHTDLLVEMIHDRMNARIEETIAGFHKDAANQLMLVRTLMQAMEALESKLSVLHLEASWFSEKNLKAARQRAQAKKGRAA